MFPVSVCNFSSSWIDTVFRLTWATTGVFGDTVRVAVPKLDPPATSKEEYPAMLVLLGESSDRRRACLWLTNVSCCSLIESKRSISALIFSIFSRFCCSRIKRCAFLCSSYVCKLKAIVYRPQAFSAPFGYLSILGPKSNVSFCATFLAFNTIMQMQSFLLYSFSNICMASLYKMLTLCKCLNFEHTKNVQCLLLHFFIDIT